MPSQTDRTRWLALIVLCCGDLMIVLDSTIVNVALPSIRADLGFSETSLAWVVNAYLLTFGGFLLLGGRLGDLFGHRRLFVGGIALFTISSLACVLAGGGTVGVLLGGILTDVLSWHWIFLVNVPIGVAVYLTSLRLLPGKEELAGRESVDVAGAVTVTAALVAAVYAIVNGNEAGWTSTQTLGLLGAAVVLLGAFLVIETRAKHPLMPLSIFRHRTLATANVMGVLMAAGLFAAFFLSALYMQLVLDYTPLEVGFAYLPQTLIWGGVSLFLSDKLVMRSGIKMPILLGFPAFALGILLFARAPVDGNYFIDMLPAMILQGFGAGVAFNPLLLAAMGDVEPQDSGLASGVVNTAFMMGGALGLAILASVADSRTDSLRASGENALEALTSGYHLAFLVGAIFAATGAALGAAVLRVAAPSAEHETPGELETVGSGEPTS